MNDRPVEPDSPELREMLVAYLDGELDGESVRQVEGLLVRDPRVGRELRQLERAWDLLDRLPRAEVDPSFTRSTVEMVAVAVEDELKPTSPDRGRRASLVVIVLLVAAAAGFLGTRLWPDGNRQLLLDLPILENLEAYRQSPSIEFVKQLSDTALFANEPAVTTKTVTSDEDRLHSLTSEQKEELHRNYERFIHLPADEQDRLRKLHTAIEADERSPQLTATLAKYQRWLEQLQGVERAELIALDNEQRFERIRRMREDEARRLSPSDLQVFVDWLQAGILQRIQGPRRKELERRLAGQPELDRREILARTMNELRAAQGGAIGRGPLVPLALQLSREPGAELRKQFSPHGQQLLDQAQTPQDRWKLLQTWVTQAFGAPSVGRGMQLSLSDVSQEELKQYFETQLDPAERAKLLNLPADQMQRQLRVRYYQWKRGTSLNRSSSEKRANDE